MTAQVQVVCVELAQECLRMDAATRSGEPRPFKMKADEAERAGLVSRVVPTEEALAVAKEAAATIASKSLISVYLAKEAVNRAFDTTLTEGVRAERSLFCRAPRSARRCATPKRCCSSTITSPKCLNCTFF